MYIKTGLQVFIEEKHDLEGARVGLVTHPAAVLPDLTHSLDALRTARVDIRALFGPEHGYLGFEADAKSLDNLIDPRTGLPVFSLYGEHLAPTAEMLAGLDLLLFDMQDVGARFYTFISTLYHVLQSAGKFGKPVIVLDRPNPLGGEVGEGPLVEPGFESFIGIVPVPVLHGMTTGEIALWMNASCSLKADVKVVRMQGWQRTMDFEATGLKWVPTSPGMPHLSTVYVYPCTCLFEGTNFSEGRGTPLPFEIFGAPRLDGFLLAERMNRLDLPGVRFRPTVFTPTESKHSGQVCQGIQVHLRALKPFRPLYTAVHLMQNILQICEDFSFMETSWEGTHPHLDLLLGSASVRQQLLGGVPVQQICSDWGEIRSIFDKQRKDILLYS